MESLDLTVRTDLVTGIAKAWKAQQRGVVDACEIGRVGLLLASQDTTAIAGEVILVDAGCHIEGMVFH